MPAARSAARPTTSPSARSVFRPIPSNSGGSSFFPSCTSYEATIGPDNIQGFYFASKVARRPYRLPGGPELLDAAAVPATVAATGTVQLTVRADDTRYNTASGAEPAQSITRVDVFLTPPWSSGATPIGSMSPQDGNFNSTIETAQWNLPGSMLQPGRQLVYLQATDGAGPGRSGQRGIRHAVRERCYFRQRLPVGARHAGASPAR